MAVKYIPYYPDTIDGQAILDNFSRTRRVLKYRDNDKVFDKIRRGMPLYEMELQERVGENKDKNLVVRGECVSACAYLKEQGVEVDLVYIDPPFASGADYAKKIYIRRNPKVAAAIKKAEEELSDDELKAFEEKMYGDVWDKEKYLNWMYENLMAIKSVMSETASIYVHLDWHIGHYVKILLDEIFGEDNFQREIIWHRDNASGGKAAANNWIHSHDSIFYYKKSFECVFNKQYDEYSEEYIKQRFIYNDNDGLGSYRLQGDNRKQYLADSKGKAYTSVWNIPDVNVMALERMHYTTQKPEALLERVITASSNEGMVVADFFGGSGVTAAVAAKLGRKFIHCDVGINSVQTTRDRLVANGASFDVLEVKDGVSLFRNPVQTMDKLKSLIPGLRNEESLPAKAWAGAIVDSKFGMMPVYLPNLLDSNTKLMDIPQINTIVREALPDLPSNIKKAIVYYVDIEDVDEIEKFIKENNDQTLIEIELRDLKNVLDDVVVEDHAEFVLKETADSLFKGWQVDILKFLSDRVQQKIDAYNQKGEVNTLRGDDEEDMGDDEQPKKRTKFKRIDISDDGLELVEFLSLDCISENGSWHSDSEIKIDKLGCVIRNGQKTKDFWDGSIRSENKPKRLKIRNICGDETEYKL